LTGPHRNQQELDRPAVKSTIHRKLTLSLATSAKGQVRVVHGHEATGLQLVQSYSDSDEDSDGAWDGRLGDRYNPPGSLLPTLWRPSTLMVLDQNIRLYDTTRGRFHLQRTVKARDVGWSVLDVCFTPDARHVLYSSWSDYNERRFCVFSLAASTDGKEILGGANDGCLYVFDLEQNKRTLKVSEALHACFSAEVKWVGDENVIPEWLAKETLTLLFARPPPQIDAHEDDVNAVAFADSSSQLLFSGSDDALCKVWDRRTLREDRPLPVGQLAGHRDGITFIHSKGDARYLISNSKDQSIKLWDIRKFSPKEGLAASRLAVTQQNWDYRWQQVPQRALKKHKLTGDTSVMTYRGHGVLHTLIRCRFSPEFSTGQRFIYSGCSTGKIVMGRSGADVGAQANPSTGGRTGEGQRGKETHGGRREMKEEMVEAKAAPEMGAAGSLEAQMDCDRLLYPFNSMLDINDQIHSMALKYCFGTATGPHLVESRYERRGTPPVCLWIFVPLVLCRINRPTLFVLA
ncbi:hypothetical protein GOODEAATRI_014852, partial [Goodea atripinnis]